jgi:GTP-binding protein
MRQEEPEEELTSRVYRLAPEESITVERIGGEFRVRGRTAERIVAMAALVCDEGIADFQRQLERAGVLKALEDAGVKPGDTVHIAEFELEWT